MQTLVDNEKYRVELTDELKAALLQREPEVAWSGGRRLGLLRFVESLLTQWGGIDPAIAGTPLFPTRLLYIDERGDERSVWLTLKWRRDNFTGRVEYYVLQGLSWDGIGRVVFKPDYSNARRAS